MADAELAPAFGAELKVAIDAGRSTSWLTKPSGLVQTRQWLGNTHKPTPRLCNVLINLSGIGRNYLA